MDGKDTTEMVRRFINCINRHQVDALCGLMTEDHVFVDALGTTVKGRETLRQGWTEYFRMFPDYQMVPGEMTGAGDIIGVFGTARGTYAPDGILKSENHWEIPAAWKAVVHEGLVSEWRVYCNIETVVKIVEKSKIKK